MSQAQFDKFSQQTDAEMAQSQKQYDAQMALQQRSLDQADAAAAVSKSVADKQIDAMNQNMQFAQQDRDRYTNTFLPLQNQFIADANAYDTPARREQAASQALADNQTQIDAQRQNASAQLVAMGVDPSQVMSSSLSTQLGVAGAATGAMNANNARLQVEGTGRQLKAAAIDMGNGLPAQAQAGYQTASNAGNNASNAANGAVNNYNAASGIGATASGIRQNSLNTAASITGSPMSWASLGNQSYGGASNGIMNASSIQNQMFQNQMSAQKMKNDNAASSMQAIGSIASIAGMAMMAEGGVVGQDGMPQDLPPISDWQQYGQPQFQMPQTSIDTTGMDLKHATAVGAGALSGGGGASKYGSMIQQIGGALGALGTAEKSHPDQNMQQQWLRPVYRAEGGVMDAGMNGQQGQVQVGGVGQYKVMPNMQSRDQIITALSPGEVVIPADVVRVKGQEFFDKLIDKHHRPGA